MKEFGLEWLNLSLVWCGFFVWFGRQPELKYNTKVILDNRESSGSAIQFNLRTCFLVFWCKQYEMQLRKQINF